MNKAKTPTTAKTSVLPHDFEPDPDVPADYHERQYCLRCRTAGRPGDARHPDGALPMPPVGDDARRLTNRILGEATED